MAGAEGILMGGTGADAEVPPLSGTGKKFLDLKKRREALREMVAKTKGATQEAMAAELQVGRGRASQEMVAKTKGCVPGGDGGGAPGRGRWRRRWRRRWRSPRWAGTMAEFTLGGGCHVERGRWRSPPPASTFWIRGSRKWAPEVGPVPKRPEKSFDPP